MRFQLFDSVMNLAESTHDAVDILIDRASDELHEIEARDADLLEQSSWYKSARQTRRRLLLAATSRPPRAAPTQLHSKLLEVRDAASAALAASMALTPLTIIVEDTEADGLFLEMVVEELAEIDLKSLWARSKSSTPPAIVIDSPGGVGQIPGRIKRLAREAAEAKRVPRLFALCDSDARWPGDDLHSGKDIEKIAEESRNAGTKFHVLKKRMCENYIPDDVISAIKTDPNLAIMKPYVDALERRSPVQRDHLPLKDGLTKAERDEGIRVGFYVAAEEPDLVVLEGRLFSKRPRAMIQVADRYRAQVTSDGLRARDGAGELEGLLVEISKEL